MTSLLLTTGSAASQRSQSGQYGTVDIFLGAGASKSGSADKLTRSISATILSSEKLQAELRLGINATSRNQRLDPAEAKHQALAKVISENRDLFPPEPFTISTQLTGGKSVDTAIPSIKGNASQGGQTTSTPVNGSVRPDGGTRTELSTARINATETIVNTLVLKAGNPAGEELA